MDLATSHLPSSWVQVPVKDVFRIVGGGTPSTQKPEYWEGNIPWISSADIDESGKITPRRAVTLDAVKSSATNLVPAGSLIVVTRVGLGKVGTATTDLCFSQDSQALVFNPAFVNSNFVAYQMRVAVGEFKYISRGTTISGVTVKQLQDVSFSLAPLPEQHRIVAEIERQFSLLDAGIANLKRVQANLKRYRAAVLQAACTGQLVPTEAETAKAEGRPYEPATVLLTRILAERRARWEAEQLAKMETQGKLPLNGAWKAKYQEPTAPDTRGLPELPEGWVWTNVASLIVEGPQNGIYLPSSAYGSGVPILRIDDYQNNSSRSSNELRKVRATDEERCRYSLNERDMVINRVNSMTHIGKCLLIQGRNLPALFESNMMRLRVASFVKAEFCEAYLHSYIGRHRLTSNAKWAVNQASINQTDVGITPFPLPPLAEQERIVAEVERRLSVVDNLEQVVKANLKRAERLRQAVLKEAFAGRLVPQDPADEPASVLLERIKADREAQARAPAKAKVPAKAAREAGRKQGVFTL